MTQYFYDTENRQLIVLENGTLRTLPEVGAEGVKEQNATHVTQPKNKGGRPRKERFCKHCQNPIERGAVCKKCHSERNKADYSKRAAGGPSKAKPSLQDSDAKE